MSCAQTRSGRSLVVLACAFLVGACSDDQDPRRPASTVRAAQENEGADASATWTRAPAEVCDAREEETREWLKGFSACERDADCEITEIAAECLSPFLCSTVLSTKIDRDAFELAARKRQEAYEPECGCKIARCAPRSDLVAYCDATTKLCAYASARENQQPSVPLPQEQAAPRADDLPADPPDIDPDSADARYVRESRRLPIASLPFEAEPPDGRDVVFQSFSSAFHGRAIEGPGFSDEELARRTNALVAPYDNGEAILIDLLLTETKLASSEVEALALALGARGRIDILRLVYDHADAFAIRFEVFCGNCEPGAVHRSLAREARDAVLAAVDLAHSPEGFALLEHIEATEQSSALPERQELAMEARFVRARW